MDVIQGLSKENREKNTFKQDGFDKLSLTEFSNRYTTDLRVKCLSLFLLFFSSVSLLKQDPP